MLKSRQVPTELSALISEAPEELESDDDEGLISFEEERVRASQLVHSCPLVLPGFYPGCPPTPEPPACSLGTDRVP